MADTPETLADALAAARAMLDDDSWIDEVTALNEDGEQDDFAQRVVHVNDVRDALDRIEAAAKRERASLEDALSHCREFATKIERENEEGETRLDAEEIIATVDNEFAGIRPASAPSNAAALREALEQALAYCESDQKSGIAYSDNDVLVPMLRAALAAPARNVDRFKTAEDAAQAYRRETESDRQNADCYWPCIFDWLFATAKGGAK